MSIDIENNGNSFGKTVLLSQQHGIEFYQREYNLLQQEIKTLIEENRQLNSDVKSFANREQSSLLAFKKCTDDVIQNLNDQIASLTDENSTHQQLCSIGRHTIDYLEREISVYRKQCNNPNLIAQLKIDFEHSLEMLRSENEQLKSSKMTLEQSKQMCEQQLSILDKKHNDLIVEHKQVMEQLVNTEQIAGTNRLLMTTLKAERDEFEKQYRLLSDLHSQCKIREMLHFTKIQDSVNLAETAIKERDVAIEREKEIREECDRLASTIGRVMEEAGDRVDSNIDEMKREYAEKFRKMEILLKKASMSNDVESKNNELSRRRIIALEERLEQTLTTNAALDRELQVASKTIIELEIKIEAYEKLISRENETTKESDERSTQLLNLLESNKRLKQRWKATFDEMTEHLQMQLKTMHKENAVLLVENRRLKSVPPMLADMTS